MEENQERSGTLRVRRVRLDEIFFKEYICDEFRNSRYPLPENIRKSRNVAIRLGFLELLCCLGSLLFYAERRSRVILALIVMTWISTAFGFISKLRLSYTGLLAHACYTISVLGGFYIYIMIDYAMGTDRQSTKTSGSALGDTTILVISSIPLLGLFAMGIYSLCLLIMLDDELEARKKNDREVEGSNRLEGRRSDTYNHIPAPAVI
jgi:hypothetical protein